MKKRNTKKEIEERIEQYQKEIKNFHNHLENIDKPIKVDINPNGVKTYELDSFFHSIVPSTLIDPDISYNQTSIKNLIFSSNPNGELEKFVLDKINNNAKKDEAELYVDEFAFIIPENSLICQKAPKKIEYSNEIETPRTPLTINQPPFYPPYNSEKGILEEAVFCYESILNIDSLKKKLNKAKEFIKTKKNQKSSLGEYNFQNDKPQEKSESDLKEKELFDLSQEKSKKDSPTRPPSMLLPLVIFLKSINLSSYSNTQIADVLRLAQEKGQYQETQEVNQNKITQTIPEKDELKDILSILNYAELNNPLFFESQMCFDMLKNDSTTQKISRNYANIHKIELAKNMVFLKIYSPKNYSYSVNACGQPKSNIKVCQSKENEAHFLSFLKGRKGINVPDWYCHGEISDIHFMLQEKIEGEQIGGFIEKNPKEKGGIIKSAIEQLVRIHDRLYNSNYFIDWEICKKNKKSNDSNKKLENILNKMFENNFFDKFIESDTPIDHGVLKEYEPQYKCGNKTKFLRACAPITKEISNLGVGVYIDANPANVLVDKDKNIHNVDFENVKTLPFQFDLSIFSAGLGLSDKEQTEIIDYYLKEKSKIEQKEYSNEEMKEFHRGYNFVNILRNLILVGNMREYISKYQDVQALNDQTRYFRQAKKAIKRAIHSEYMANEDKKIIMNFKKELGKFQIIYKNY